jgi:hypothetical protein
MIVAKPICTLFPALMCIFSCLAQGNSTAKNVKLNSHRHESKEVVVFSLPPLYSYVILSGDSVQKKKFWSVFQEEYSIFDSAGKVYCTLLIDHCNEDCSATLVSISTPLEFTDSNLYNDIINNKDCLTTEVIKPFVFKLPDGSTDTLRGSHAPYYYIGIHSPFAIIKTSFNVYDFEEKFSNLIPDRRNLNYESNRRTRTFEFFTRLENYFIQNIQSFSFD